MTDNVLYYGDNLDILRRYIHDESVDLVYLDPPFNSKATYNVLFGEKNGSRSESQIKAFEDTWHWDAVAAEAYDQVLEGGGQVAEAMRAFRTLLGGNDMLAYLSMMAPRLVELRRVLKPTGSIYLHCDPTASHYLKVLMDAVFGPGNYRNEIIWKRRTGSSSAVHQSNKFGVCTDSILFYARTEAAALNAQYNFDALGYQEYVDKFFTHVDENGRRYALDNLANPAPRPNLMYEYRGYKPPRNGWAISREKMQEWESEGRLHFPADKNGRIRRKRYLDELRGKPVQSLWDDIEPIGAQAAERLGYPTQKPEGLLERIISASSHEGDLVLDPFCGCGTAVVVAERQKRLWIGIDITYLAVALMKHRIWDTFRESAKFRVLGEPTSLPDAKALAGQDPYQFQYWALGLVGARPAEQKKGADQGIDGRLYFHDEAGGKTKQVVISVKSGHVSVSQLRDLVGVVEREKAQIGLFITLEEPTQPMRSEAASGRFYDSPGWGQKYPKIQILTIEELLQGAKLQYPPKTSVTFKEAPKAKRQEGATKKLPGM